MRARDIYVWSTARSDAWKSRKIDLPLDFGSRGGHSSLNTPATLEVASATEAHLAGFFCP
jgi:hypothetical protein